MRNRALLATAVFMRPKVTTCGKPWRPARTFRTNRAEGATRRRLHRLVKLYRELDLCTSNMISVGAASSTQPVNVGTPAHIWIGAGSRLGTGSL
jgi:hypothetical protein